MNLENAIDKAKGFFVKMKGLDIEFSGRPLIDWLNFEAVIEKETDYQFHLVCSFQENLFNDNRAKFKVIIDKDKGEIKGVQRIP